MIPVGAGLLANAVCQAALLYLTHRIREQARSHKGVVYLDESIAKQQFVR